MKTALICGISGQDGSYLSRLLLEKNYEVHGTSRDVDLANWNSLYELGIYKNIKLHSMLPSDFKSVLDVFNKCNPDEVYFLAGQSSVALSFEQPLETIQSSVIGILNILEVCKISKKKIRIYNAGSSECFGDITDKIANEDTNFQPKSPYAVGKATSYWLVSNYRNAYNLYACTGILFNHESPLRPTRFVTQKIIQTAKKIANGSNEKLSLGRLDIERDWGYAPEYVEAMWKMLQLDKPTDFVIATGETYSLKYFVEQVFQFFNLNWKNHVVQDPKFYRPTELKVSRADPSKAFKELGWKAKIKFNDTIKILCEYEYKKR